MLRFEGFILNMVSQSGPDCAPAGLVKQLSVILVVGGGCCFTPLLPLSKCSLIHGSLWLTFTSGDLMAELTLQVFWVFEVMSHPRQIHQVCLRKSIVCAQSMHAEPFNNVGTIMGALGLDGGVCWGERVPVL